MPCSGCRENGMREIKGFFRMKFIGCPEGKLMKGARAGYVQNQVYEVPFHYSKFPYWKLLDPVPELKVPVASVEDSVFGENVFVPKVEETTKPVITLTVDVPESTEEDADLPEIIDHSNIGVLVKRRGRKKVVPEG